MGGGARKDGSPYEPSVIALKDGRLMLVYGRRHGPTGARNLEEKYTTISSDHGKTWSAPEPLVQANGDPVRGGRALTLLRLKSGAIGCLTSDVFHRSEDEGETWSSGVTVGTVGDEKLLVRNDSAVVLSSGRIVAPAVRYGFEPRRAEEGLVFLSDDEGRSWREGPTLFLDAEKTKTEIPYGWDEWSVVELQSGDLLGFVRTTFGQLFQTTSTDQGATWSKPTPTGLAADQAPCLLRRIPESGHLLVIWTQASVEERERYLTRHRLSCAISRDEGKTWEKFKNLESLDDVSRVEPPTDIRVIRANPEKYPEAKEGYHQPRDRKRYHKAPGALRCAYPTCTFVDDQAVITYGYGSRHGPIGYVACKIRVLPQAWFSE